MGHVGDEVPANPLEPTERGEVPESHQGAPPVGMNHQKQRSIANPDLLGDRLAVPGAFQGVEDGGRAEHAGRTRADGHIPSRPAAESGVGEGEDSLVVDEGEALVEPLEQGLEIPGPAFRGGQPFANLRRHEIDGFGERGDAVASTPPGA